MLVDSHQPGIQYLLGVDWLEFELRVRRWRRQDHADPLRSFHDVSVRHDVAIRIDDDASANGMLPGDFRCRFVSLVLRRPVPVDRDLDHSRGNFCHDFLKRAVQFS